MSVLNRPPVRCAAISLAISVIVLGCSDTTGMRSQPQSSDQALHFLSWRAPVTPRFSVRGSLLNRGGGLRPDGVSLGSSSGDISLEHNSASFWAVRGESRSVQINYLAADDVSHPFLRLATSDPTFVPGRGELAVGDSVLVSITVDPTTLKVSLEPTGLQFGTASQLEFWYGGASGDLNGDGLVDDTDARIEGQLLGMWWREGAGDSWSQIQTTQSLENKSFTSFLLHFCDYAVSW